MSLKSYIITRALLTIPTVLILVTIVFLIVRVLPGDPALLHFGKGVSPAALAQVRHALGLDMPIYVQYVNYLVGLFQGNLGLAFSNEQPVAPQVLSAFPATLELSIGSMIVAVIVGVVLGVRSSRKYGSVEDTTIRTFGVVVYSIPVFFLGLIFIAVFAIYFHVLPSGGRISTVVPVGGTIFGVHIQTGLYTVDSLLAGDFGEFVDAIRHLILPCTALGLYISAVFLRITRSNMLETLGQEYVTAAKARGLKERTVLYSYGLRNGLLPVLTIMGLEFAGLLGGAILTETTFAWNGIGTYIVTAISDRDYIAIQGSVVFFGILVALVSLVVDILYAYLDPRIRY
ncbi:MAG TPA: ABC transporter permease [Nitrososphaerales archaeon]|nr:ABC transporter permease [Nitrososphaerales archaeon]